jgi:hypothetical protein
MAHRSVRWTTASSVAPTSRRLPTQASTRRAAPRTSTTTLSRKRRRSIVRPGWRAATHAIAEVVKRWTGWASRWWTVPSSARVTGSPTTSPMRRAVAGSSTPRRSPSEANHGCAGGARFRSTAACAGGTDEGGHGHRHEHQRGGRGNGNPAAAERHDVRAGAAVCELPAGGQGDGQHWTRPDAQSSGRIRRRRTTAAGSPCERRSRGGTTDSTKIATQRSDNLPAWS